MSVTSLTDTPHATDREPYLSSTCNEETGSDDAVFKAWTLTSPLLVASLAPPPPQQQQRTPNQRATAPGGLHTARGRRQVAYFFLAAGFLAAAFFGAAFLAAGFFGAAFLAAGFLALGCERDSGRL